MGRLLAHYEGGGDANQCTYNRYHSGATPCRRSESHAGIAGWNRGQNRESESRADIAVASGSTGFQSYAVPNRDRHRGSES